VYEDEDGMVVVRGRFEPEVGTLLMRALEAAGEALYRTTRGAEETTEAPPTPAQRRADALALVAETALQQGLDPEPAGERYQVVVHVDAPALADPDSPGQSVLDNGARVSAETSRRLACDAHRVVMRHDTQGRVLDVGRRTRTIPPALRLALWHRDWGCRFPGCGVRHGQGHHIQHWANGGATRLENLTLLCHRHHRAVHEEGYGIERLLDGALHFRRPDGRPIPEVPPPAAAPADPVAALITRHRGEGLTIGAWSACPSWRGERLDLAWAIDVLRPVPAHAVPG
jgi:5-methylcytosine-specific restriction endonuclease McrA